MKKRDESWRTTTDFIQFVRAVCSLTIKNTGAGNYLGQSLSRLERLEKQNSQLLDEIERLRKR